jgi:hypothetical protein
MKSDTVPRKWTYGTSWIGYRLVRGLGWCSIMTMVPPELDAILHEIEKALDAKLYYLAIAVALSVPDICACLEFDPDQPAWADRKTYATWCNAHLCSRFKNMDGDDLYNLRGGVLHKGRFEHQKARFNRVMFIGPESRIKVRGDIIITVAADVKFGGIGAADMRLAGKILQLDLVFFCRSIMEAAREWAIANANMPNVQQNLPNLVRIRPEGFPPFSVGVPTVT